MTTNKITVVIPMAGWGTRMRPHTWSKPKPLVSVAGKTALEHLLDIFSTLPHPVEAEFVFIVGPYLGEAQIPAFIKEHYPELNAHYVVQSEMKGQSHALWLAREHLHGPLIICFSDTLMETDFAFIAKEKSDVVAWVMAVPDPRRFGVAELGADGWVKKFIEKPTSMENNKAVIGCYYFKEGQSLLSAVNDQMKKGIMFKNEYFLTDAITIMIEQGAKVRTHEINTWLDTGTIEATLETNKRLLEKMKSTWIDTPGITILPPVFIHPGAIIENSRIGPYVSVSAHCRITNSQVADSILEEDCEIRDAVIYRSLIGRQAKIQGCNDGQVLTLNVGDQSSVIVSEPS